MDEMVRIGKLELKVVELQAKLDFVMHHLGVQYVPPAIPPGMSVVVALLKEGDKLGAIKTYRQVTGADLGTAKTAVDQLEATMLR
jgi:hypothetical protein